MKKETKVAEEVTEVKEVKANPVAEALKTIRDLPQADRLTLYNKLDDIINYDRDKVSQGIDASCHLFDEAINSL